MSKVRRRDLTSSFVALAAKREEERNLNCDFDDDRERDKDRILPRSGIGFQTIATSLFYKALQCMVSPGVWNIRTTAEQVL